MIKLSRSAVALGATLGALLVSVVSFDAQAASKSLEYTVLRDGNPIGTHSFSIDTNGADTNVTVNTDIKVKALFFTVYQFIHDSKETWNNGHLTALTSTTDDDGIPKTLTMKAENGKMTVDAQVQGHDRRQFAPAGAIPASLWNMATVKQSMIVNTLDGQFMKVKIESVGEEKVEASGRTVSANHFKLTGELTRDLWYNSAGDLVRMSFPDKKKVQIIYSLN